MTSFSAPDNFGARRVESRQTGTRFGTVRDFEAAALKHQIAELERQVALLTRQVLAARRAASPESTAKRA